MTARPNTISRRRMLGLAGAALGVGAAGLVAGCGSPLAAGVVGAPPRPGTTTFWNLWGGGDGKRAEEMYDAYRNAHGGPASLEAVTFAWGNPYYTSVLEYVYNTGFTDYRVGAASAASMVFFLLILGVSAVWLTLTRRSQAR